MELCDAQGANAGMAIPVKELLQLQKANKNRVACTILYCQGPYGRVRNWPLYNLHQKTLPTFISKDESNWQMTWQLVNLLFKNILVV